MMKRAFIIYSAFTVAVSMVFFIISVFPVSVPSRDYLIKQSLGAVISLWAIESLIIVEYIIKRGSKSPTE